jgi:hypothetical protein
MEKKYSFRPGEHTLVNPSHARMNPITPENSGAQHPCKKAHPGALFTRVQCTQVKKAHKSTPECTRVHQSTPESLERTSMHIEHAWARTFHDARELLWGCILQPTEILNMQKLLPRKIIVLAFTMCCLVKPPRKMVSDATTSYNHNQPQSIHFWKLD